MTKKIITLIFLGALMAPSFSLDLGESLNLALENNPQVVAAKNNVDVAYAKLGEAGANLFPHVTASISKGKNYQESPAITLPPVLGGGTLRLYPDEAADTTNYNLSVTQPLFAGGKILTGISIAQINHVLANESLKKVKLDTTYNVTSAYFSVLKAQKYLGLIKQASENLNRNLKLAEISFQSGLIANTDLLMIKTQLANVEISRIQADNGLKLARLGLEATIGKKLDENFVPSEEAIAVSQLVIPKQAELLKLAYQHRPDWVSCNLGIKTAEEALRIAYGGYLPTLAYSFSEGRTKTSYPTSSSSNSNLANWRSMLVGSWNLFDGFSTAHQVQEGNAALNVAKAQKQSLRDAIDMEVYSTFFNLQSAVENIAASQVAADLAERAYRSAEINYQANIISTTTFLDIQNSKLSAQNNLWSAKYDLEIAKAGLNKAVGIKII